MNPRFNPFKWWAVLLAISLFGLVSCLIGPTAGRGSEVENEIYGVLVDIAGTPVAGATVKKVPTPTGIAKFSANVKRSGDTDSVFTDSRGRYSFPETQAGAYNLIGDFQSGSLVVLIPDVEYKESYKSLNLDTDTLRAPGRIRGRLRMNGMGKEGVLAFIPGTSYLAVSDDSGAFIIAGVPKGRYSVRYSATGLLAAPDTGVVVMPGETTELPVKDIGHDTLLAPPTPQGFEAAVDSQSARVFLKWEPVQVADLKGYVLYRDDPWDGMPREIGFVTGTAFIDSTFPIARTENPLVYRIKSRDNDLNLSLTYSSPAKAPRPQAWLLTTVLKWEQPEDDTIESGGFPEFVVQFMNPTRSVTSVSWKIGSDTVSQDWHSLGTRAGRDTIRRFLGEGRYSIEVKVGDQGNGVATLKREVTVIPRRVGVDAGKDTVVRTGEPVHLHGRAIGFFGPVMMWEWDIGATGTFVRTSSGDTSIILPPGVDSLDCILRGRDDSGRVVLDTVYISVSDSSVSLVLTEKEWERVEPTDPMFGPRLGYSVASFKDRLWVISGYSMDNPDAVREIWSSEDGRQWVRVPAQGLSPYANRACVVFAGKLWIIGGLGPDESAANYHSEDGIHWTRVPARGPSSRRFHVSVVVHAGKMWMIGGLDLGQGFSPTPGDVWSSTDGENWIQEVDTLRFRPMPGAQAVVSGGRIHISDKDGNLWTSMDGRSWSAHPRFSPRPFGLDNVAIHPLGSNLWVFHAATWTPGPVYVWKIPEPGSEMFKSIRNPFGGSRGFIMATHRDAMWVFASTRDDMGMETIGLWRSR